MSLEDILFDLACNPPLTAEKVEAAAKLYPQHAAELRDHAPDLALEMLADEFGVPVKMDEDERERLIQIGLRAAMPHRRAEG